MRIIIFEGTFETTAFIRRLVKGLQENNQVFVLGFNIKLKNKVQGVNYISLGSNQHKLDLVKSSLQHQGINIVTFKNIIGGERKKLQQKNLEIILDKIKPDVIHVQWPSILPWVEPYLENQKYPIILSQRGYHTNIRPFVNLKNFNYLKSLYPKLSGLHSVSKAISSKSKKIGTPKTCIDDVVYTGLNLEMFSLNYQPKKNNILQIVSVGRPHWIKGYSYAIRACNLLKEKGVGFTYTIVGGAENEELIYLIKLFNLEENIILTKNII